jgi:thiol-disulfide isomerase/thioredoxin
LVLVAILPLAVACGGSSSEASKTYVFKSGESAVKVDTPALRQQKADAGIATCPTVRGQASKVNGGLPHATLPCLGGGPSVDLAALRGRPAVLNLWAQSCAPCRHESPIIQRFASLAGDDVRVLGIDFEDSLPGRAIAFAAQYGLTYPQLADPDAVLKGPLRVAGLPLTVFVTPGGRIAGKHYGPVSSLASLEAMVHEYLGVRT